MMRFQKTKSFLIAVYVSLFACGTFAQSKFEEAAAIAHQSCEAFKGKSMSMVVAFSAGGGFDLEARALRPFLQRHSRMDIAVINMPGAGGMLAAHAVADMPSTRLIIGLLDPRTIATGRFEGYPGPGLAELAVVGSMGFSRAMWVSSQPLAWDQLASRRLIGSGGAQHLIRLLLPAKALGMNVAALNGLRSTNELWSSLLRGELDIAVLGSDTAERFLKTSPNVTVSLILSHSPDPAFPGVPYLAGPGGMAERLSKNASVRMKSERMALASVVALTANTSRFLFTSSKASETTRLCLETAFAAAMLDPERLTSSIVKDSNLQPLTLTEAKRMQSDIHSAFERNSALLSELSRSAASQR